MPTVRELSRWIRDYGHDAKHQQRLIADTFIWHQLWSAMDIIDDVDSAMEAYLSNDFPESTGERYLRIYGALQGLFIQQDALTDLIKAIHPTKGISIPDVLKDIREARNASVGHPTQLKREGKLSTHGIVQHSMNKDGFELFSYPRHEGKIFQYIPLRGLIEKQRAETVRILEEVVNELREQDKAHRVQFRETKLTKAFDQASYAFEKIFEEIRPHHSPALGRWAVGHLQKCLDDFEQLMKDRGLSVETYDSIKYLYGEIAHPLTELKKYTAGEQSEILSDKSAAVFATTLRAYFDELRHIAEEIDEEYASDPEPVVQPQKPTDPISWHVDIVGS